MLKVLKTAASGIATQDYLADYRTLKSIKGWRVETSGKVTELDKDHIVHIASDFAGGSYSEEQTFVATFPEVAIGDIIAF